MEGPGCLQERESRLGRGDGGEEAPGAGKAAIRGRRRLAESASQAPGIRCRAARERPLFSLTGDSTTGARVVLATVRVAIVCSREVFSFAGC